MKVQFVDQQLQILLLQKEVQRDGHSSYREYRFCYYHLDR